MSYPSGYYDLYWTGYEWVAFDPYKFEPNHIYWKGARICGNANREHCIQQAEKLGNLWGEV